MLSTLLRTSAFLRKEWSENLRQPRLLFGLVIGPFLILLLVGIGFRNQAESFRTLFVINGDGPLTTQVRQLSDSVSPQIDHVGTTNNLESGLVRLQRADVDLVIEFPNDPGGKIESGQQAVFKFYNAEIDPSQASYIGYFAQVFASQVNNLLLKSAASEGQQRSISAEAILRSAEQQAAALQTAMERGDQDAAQRHQGELQAELGILQRLAAVTGSTAAETQDGSGKQPASDVSAQIDDIQQLLVQGSQPSAAGETNDAVERVSQVRQKLSGLEGDIQQFQQVPASLLVSPFRGEAENIAPVSPTFTSFFLGPIIALLLQHLALTFAALSVVRDRQLGFIEAFRAAPLRSAEMIIGKYLSHGLLALLVAAALTALAIYGLGVPMIGSWRAYGLVIGAVVFTSLGIGLVISLVSESDSQAVLYSMMMLLASVFFGGFFIRLPNLWVPVRAISWLLPTTYGASLLQDITLRGLGPDPLRMVGLVALGALFMILSVVLAKRLFRPA
ncbi:MAG: ABC transporter permease [Anaerolineales bacterium]